MDHPSAPQPFFDPAAISAAVDALSPSELLNAQIYFFLLSVIAATIPLLAHLYAYQWTRTWRAAAWPLTVASLGTVALASMLESFVRAPWPFELAAAAIPSLAAGFWIRLGWPKDSMRENLACRPEEEPEGEESKANIAG